MTIKPMRWARAFLRIVLLLFTALEAYISFLALAARTRGPVAAKARAEWLHRWCATVLPRLGIAYQCEGPLPASGMIICNHVSYVDIFVLSAIVPCIFVGKKEIDAWPIFGALSRCAGTLFLDRGKRSDAQRVSGEVAERLASGAIVVLFPEGTSSDGTQVLPFHSSLFEPALNSASALTPAHISYPASEGDVCNQVAFWGEMKMLPHAMKLLGKSKVFAKVRFGESVRAEQDRKQTAITMREQVMRLAEGRN